MGRDKKVTLKDGKSFNTISDAAKAFNIAPHIVYNRLKKPGASIEEALGIIKKVDPMIGGVFGDLKVISFTRMVPKRGAYYLCLCTCGKKIERWGSTLRVGKKEKRIQSCGCKRKQILKENALKRSGKPRIDLIGKEFGFLSVLSLSKKQTNRPRGAGLRWDCRCVCGKVQSIYSGDLISGNTKSCGCRGLGHGEDWSGRQFGKLRVIGRNKRSPGTWKAECVCGRMNYYGKNKIKTKQSCGCSVPINPIGKRYGKLIVIEKPKPKTYRKWKVLCDCGNEKLIQEWRLFNNKVKSCGCINNSEFKQSNHYKKKAQEISNWYNNIISKRAPKLEDINLILSNIEKTVSIEPSVEIARTDCRGIIYMATHIPSSRKYVGQTFSRSKLNSDELLKRRKKKHFLASKKPKNHFSNALNKYGVREFDWKVLLCASDTQTLNIAEYFFIKFFNTTNDEKGFNSISGGIVAPVYKKIVRKKMSASAKKRWSGLTSANKRKLTKKQHPPNIKYKEEMVYASDLAKIAGVTANTIYNYHAKGFTGEEILEEIEKRKKHLKKVSVMNFKNGEKTTVLEFAKKFHVSEETIRFHRKNGVDDNELLSKYNREIISLGEKMYIGKYAKMNKYTVTQIENIIKKGTFEKRFPNAKVINNSSYSA